MDYDFKNIIFEDLLFFEKELLFSKKYYNSRFYDEGSKTIS